MVAKSPSVLMTNATEYRPVCTEPVEFTPLVNTEKESH